MFLKLNNYTNGVKLTSLFIPGEEMEEKQQLEEQHRAVMDKFKYKRRQIRELQDDLQTMSHTLDNLCRDEDVYVQMIEEKQNKILQVFMLGYDFN